ncbi:hypothetical protein E3P77_03052 [Wallemia ichthyophaga]|nr:hypothetical protein E3P77_03052 [Wallemia ichthyophaga]
MPRSYFTLTWNKFFSQPFHFFHSKLPFFSDTVAASAANPSAGKGGAKSKKKWSKGKVKDKAQNAVVLDRPTYDRILKEVPTFKMISQSTLIDRMKINGSLARIAIRHLHREGAIRQIVHHNGQYIYTRGSQN